MAEPVYRCQIYRDRLGEWRWRWRAGNNRIVADSGEGYSSRDAAWRAADSARRAKGRLPAHRKARVRLAPRPSLRLAPRSGGVR